MEGESDLVKSSASTHTHYVVIIFTELQSTGKVLGEGSFDIVKEAFKQCKVMKLKKSGSLYEILHNGKELP